MNREWIQGSLIQNREYIKNIYIRLVKTFRRSSSLLPSFWNRRSLSLHGALFHHNPEKSPLPTRMVKSFSIGTSSLLYGPMVHAMFPCSARMLAPWSTDEVCFVDCNHFFIYAIISFFITINIYKMILHTCNNNKL